MDIFQIAEENFLISFAIVFGIALLQGSVLGRGIRKRFPRLKIHARLFSIVLLTLFSINAIVNVLKFVIPDKIAVSDLTVPATPEEGLTFVINVLGLNAGFGTVLAMFISVTLILLFRFAELSKITRYFIFGISVVMLSVAIVTRFTDFVPTIFQIIMYTVYQSGLTIGIFLVTRRKETDVISELK